MVSEAPTFRDYVNVVRRVLKDEFGEEFIEEISDDYTIDELKVAEFLINDQVDYDGLIYVSIEQDPQGDIRLTVGNSIASAGIYEFDDIQTRVHILLQQTRAKLRSLHNQNKLIAVIYPSPTTHVRATLSIDVLDYGIFHTDDVGNRWSMFLPLAELQMIFSTMPSNYDIEETLRWALKSETLGMVFSWLSDYAIDEITEFEDIVADSWEHYQSLVKE